MEVQEDTKERVHYSSCIGLILILGYDSSIIVTSQQVPIKVHWR